MKTNRKFMAVLAIVLSMILSFSVFAACSPTKLEVPSGLNYSNGKLSWNFVDGAMTYIVNIDGTEYSTSNNFYDLAALDLDVKEHTAKIKAKGDGYLKLASDYSAEIIFMIDEISDKKTMSKEEVKSIANSNDLNDAYFGIGRAINAITDTYAELTDSIYSRQKVFDVEKFSNLTWIKAKVGKMEARSITEKSAKEYFESFNKEIKAKFQVGGSYGAFSASVETAFDVTTNSEYKYYTNEIYSTFDQICGAEFVAVDEYAILDKYEDVLSDGFLEKVANVTNDQEAENFLKNFGTHVIVAGYFGGRISFEYYLANSESTWSSSTAESISTSVTAGLVGLGSASTSTGWSGKKDLGLNQGKTTEKFTAKSVGGNFGVASSLDEFNKNYSQWIDFINNKDDYSSVLVDFANGGLIAVWDLIPEKYSLAKALVKNAFEKQAAAAQTHLFEKYYREKIETQEIVDKLNIVCCNGDTDYNYKLSEEDEYWKSRHDGYEMGELVISGCLKEDDKYTLVNANEFLIKFHLLQNPEDLPKEGTFGADKISKLTVNDDSATKIYGINDFNQKIGYGVSYAKIIYKNSTEGEKVIISDLLKGKNKGEHIEIVPNSKVGNIEKIEIVIVYELHGDGGFLWDEYPNFRSSYTYNFA